MNRLNQLLDHSLILTDGGLETTLIFDHELDLPHFAAFPLLEQQPRLLFDYYIPYLELAENQKTGFILESATYKAHPVIGQKIGYSQSDLNHLNQLAISQLKELRESFKNRIDPILVSGCMGPGGDGYSLDNRMTIEEAENYHIHQISAFKEAGADLATAFTLNYVEEAIGIVIAAEQEELPVVIGFTLETDGHLIDGTSMHQAIQSIDDATDSYPVHYMINCAHPSHFMTEIAKSELCKERIKAVRANASCKSHAELDESTELDSGNKSELANYHKELKAVLPNLKIYGGCCGTDHSHIEAIAEKVML